MRILPTLADRVWFAYHCLPRDEAGKPPSWRQLEETSSLPAATFSRTVSGQRTEHRRGNFEKLALVLQVSQHWLDHGGDDGPVPTGPVPPRPGMLWTCHGALPGWKESVVRACEVDGGPPVPAAAFRAGADMVVLRLVDLVTPELATACAAYAWETSTVAEKKRYQGLVNAEDDKGRSAGSRLRRTTR